MNKNTENVQEAENSITEDRIIEMVLERIITKEIIFQNIRENKGFAKWLFKRACKLAIMDSDDIDNMSIDEMTHFLEPYIKIYYDENKIVFDFSQIKGVVATQMEIEL